MIDDRDEGVAAEVELLYRGWLADPGDRSLPQALGMDPFQAEDYLDRGVLPPGYEPPAGRASAREDGEGGSDPPRLTDDLAAGALVLLILLGVLGFVGLVTWLWGTPR